MGVRKLFLTVAAVFLSAASWSAYADPLDAVPHRYTCGMFVEAEQFQDTRLLCRKRTSRRALSSGFGGQLMAIRRACASWTFGSVSVTTPSETSALMACWSILFESENDRV